MRLVLSTMRTCYLPLVLGLIACSSPDVSGERDLGVSDDTSIAAGKVGSSLGSDLYDIGMKRCDTFGCCRRSLECCGSFCCKRGRQTGMQMPCYGEMGHPAPIGHQAYAEAKIDAEQS